MKAAGQWAGDVVVNPSMDISGLGLLDSISLTELAQLVGETLGVEIDFARVDPDALLSLDGLTDQLAQV